MTGQEVAFTCVLGAVQMYVQEKYWPFDAIIGVAHVSKFLTFHQPRWIAHSYTAVNSHLLSHEEFHGYCNALSCAQMKFCDLCRCVNIFYSSPKFRCLFGLLK